MFFVSFWARQSTDFTIIQSLLVLFFCKYAIALTFILACILDSKGVTFSFDDRVILIKKYTFLINWKTYKT